MAASMQIHGQTNGYSTPSLSNQSTSPVVRLTGRTRYHAYGLLGAILRNDLMTWCAAYHRPVGKIPDLG